MAQCLIVDDSKVIRKISRQMFENAGFGVGEAENGSAALAYLMDHEVDLVMLDWNMPVMSGIEFMEKLNASDLQIRPKVIFCTTENGLAFIRKAIDAGADDYILKPFDSKSLLRKISELGIEPQTAEQAQSH
jgi:two-component system, chemotaxis family, chemotaxis protein CheY